MNKVFYSGVNTKYRYESYFIYQVLIIGILIMCISRVVRYHKIFFKVKTGKTKRYDEQKQFLCTGHRTKWIGEDRVKMK